MRYTSPDDLANWVIGLDIGLANSKTFRSSPDPTGDVWQESHALDDCQDERPKEDKPPPTCYCCGEEIAGSEYAQWCQDGGKPLLCSSDECPGRRPPKDDR